MDQLSFTKRFFNPSDQSALIERGKKRSEWNCANISLSQRMGIGRADFARLLFSFLSLSLSIRGFPLLSALNRGCAVVRVDNRAMPTCAKDCPTAKETGQMSVALGERMHTPREAFNQRSRQNLSLSL